jgi:hypothetical protein
MRGTLFIAQDAKYWHHKTTWKITVTQMEGLYDIKQEVLYQCNTPLRPQATPTRTTTTGKMLIEAQVDFSRRVVPRQNALTHEQP